MTFVRRWQFDGAARLLATSDLDQILDPDSDLGAAIQTVIDGLSVTGSLPPGGAAGTVLQKMSGVSGDADWSVLQISDISGLSAALGNAGTLPADGTIGQVLAMASNTPGDYDWKSLAQSDITGLVAALAAKQPQDADLDAFAALSKVDNSILQVKTGAYALRTPTQVKTDLVLVKGDVGLGNVDNTSDAAKNSAAVTLTNKFMSGSANTFDEIPLAAMPEVEAALSTVTTPTAFMVKYTTSWPSRSTSGTSDPDAVVTWVGGPSGPGKSGTGATGAQDGDLWVRQAP